MRWAIGIGVVVVLLGMAEFRILPRGELSGPAAAAPVSWGLIVDDHLCLLETRAPEPRSVRVGCDSVDGVLYVHSHRWADPPRLIGASWVAEVAQNPAVRMEHEGKIYELLARKVPDPEQRNRILSARGHEPPPEDMHLFRFVSR